MVSTKIEATDKLEMHLGVLLVYRFKNNCETGTECDQVFLKGGAARWWPWGYGPRRGESSTAGTISPSN